MAELALLGGRKVLFVMAAQADTARICADASAR